MCVGGQPRTGRVMALLGYLFQASRELHSEVTVFGRLYWAKVGLCHLEILGDHYRPLANTQVNQFKVNQFKSGLGERRNAFAMRACSPPLEESLGLLQLASSFPDGPSLTIQTCPRVRTCPSVRWCHWNCPQTWSLARRDGGAWKDAHF